MTPLLTALSVLTRDASPIVGVQNLYNPVRVDAFPNRLYDNGTGVLDTLQGFFVTGAVPQTIGQTYTISVSAADVAWILRNGVYQYGPDGTTYLGLLTAGVTLSPSQRTMTWTATATGFAKFNGSYLVNGVYATTNVIPAGAFEALLPRIMINRGSLACCLTPFGDPATEPVATVMADLDGKLLECWHGDEFYTRFAFEGGNDIVFRYLEQRGNFAQNPLLQLTGWALVDEDVPASETVGAFQANYGNAPGNPLTFLIESDDAAAHRVNEPGLFMAANHGPPGRVIRTAAPHGLTNATARGSLYSKDGNLWMLVRVLSATDLMVCPQMTGPDDLWTYNGTPLTAGTLTYVSGGSATGNITFTFPDNQPTQLYPSNRDHSVKLRTDGNRRLPRFGSYEARSLRVVEAYETVNVKAVQTYIASQIGNAAELDLTNDLIPAQFSFDILRIVAPNAMTTIFYQVKALQAYIRYQAWAHQQQLLTYIAPQTLRFFAEGMKPLPAGLTQSDGSPRDFSALSDITANTLEYYFRDTYFQDAAYWADNEVHQPTLFLFEVASAGVPVKRFAIINDDEEGRSSIPGSTAIAGFLSGANKFYPEQVFNELVAAGNQDIYISAYGPVSVTADPQALVNVWYDKGGGRYAFRWHTLNTVTNYDIPLPDFLVGKAVLELKRTASLTYTVTPTGLRVTTTAPGGLSLVLY